MSGLILAWIVDLLLSKKYHPILKSKFKENKKSLITSLKKFNFKLAMNNNFDLKPSILQLFYSAFWIDILAVAFTTLANAIYTLIFFYNFLGCQVEDINVSWNWMGTLIINILFVIFVVHFASDCYKLSLRGGYRNYYLKLFFLDFLTLNFLSVIGTLVFVRIKNKILKNNDDYQVNQSILTSSVIKNYFKTILKIEIFIFLVNLIIFIIALTVGYYVENNSLKFVCVAVILWNMTFLYGWILPRMIGLIISWKMFSNLLKNQSYYFLLSTIRFLSFFLGYYYSAVLIDLIGVNETFKESIIQNF